MAKRRRKRKCVPLDECTADIWSKVFGNDPDCKARLIFATEAVPGQKYMHPLKQSVVLKRDGISGTEDIVFIAYHTSGERFEYRCKVYAPLRVDEAGVKAMMLIHEARRNKLYGSGGTRQQKTKRLAPAHPAKVKEIETGFSKDSNMHMVGLIAYKFRPMQDNFDEIKLEICKLFKIPPDVSSRAIAYIDIIKAKNPSWWRK